jgi:hypothetical protein
MEGILRSPSAAQRDVLRARIVLRTAEGQRNKQIQQALGVSKPVVIKWRRRFVADRVGAYGISPAEGASGNMMSPFATGLPPPLHHASPVGGNPLERSNSRPASERGCLGGIVMMPDTFCLQGDR